LHALIYDEAKVTVLMKCQETSRLGTSEIRGSLCVGIPKSYY